MFKSGVLKVFGILVEIIWFVIIVLVVIYVFLCMLVGNWIFVFGGDKVVVFNFGVLVSWVKILLFMLIVCCVVMVVIIIVMDVGLIDVCCGF